jgi:hypothetical protein
MKNIEFSWTKAHLRYRKEFSERHRAKAFGTVFIKRRLGDRGKGWGFVSHGSKDNFPANLLDR